MPTAPALPAAAPPRVLARLRAAADADLPVVHAGRDAVYVDLAGWCVGVVSTAAAQVPCALRTRLRDLPAVRTVRVEAGVLHLDGRPLVVGRVVDVRAPRVAVAGAGPVPDVAALVGAGPGLTPYGDDVLCGWLAAQRAAGRDTPQVDAEVRRHLHRTTLLSATLLDCALHGEVLPQAAAYLAAVGTPAEPAAAAALAAVGASSGAGLLEGIRLAVARRAA